MRFNRDSPARGFVCFSCLLMFVTSGCFGGKREVTGDVAGKVTLNGQPVTSGSINYISKEGKAAGMDLDANGQYTIRNVVVGKYKVIISPPALPPPGLPGSEKKKGMAEFPGHPKKYRSDLTTDLEAEVTKGKHEFNFDLKPDPAKKSDQAKR